VYICGTFNIVGGSGKIARWSKARQAWEGLGVTNLGIDDRISCMAFDANGDLYVGGDFTNIAGVTDANYIAKYAVETGNWSKVGTGISYPSGAVVLAIAISPDGTIFIGGDFDTAGGDTNCNYIAYFDKTANDWRPLSSGLNNGVNALKFTPDGRLLIGGYFTNANGANGNYICWWDGIAFRSFTELGATELNDQVESIDINPNGTIIIGGHFTNAGGDPNANGIAAWRGNNWGALMAGGISGSLAIVYRVYCLPNGDIYISGMFDRAGYLEIGRVAKSVSGAWQRLDIDLPANGVPIYSILESSDGTLYLGGAFDTITTEELAVSAGAIDLNVSSGSANTYPFISVMGPGKLNSIINYSTGAHIEFNDLTLQEGEWIGLNFDPVNLKFRGGWAGRGNLLRYVNPGSDYGNFYLKPGVNSISVFMDKATTTAATNAWITWKPRFWGIDGALLE